MKATVLLYLFISVSALPVAAQLCPGGGLTFVDAVPFDPAWIYGCNTGTSCNGGVSFNNQSSCQPTTALDACAPAPSCGSILHNASNVWFTFLPIGATATISCFQNTSLVLGIQAFSGGPLCGSLTEIGCALAGGPSSGVQLHLTGLHPGTLYYFRTFGSATPVSQRTGLFCFCGTTGLSSTLLPAALSGFNGVAAGNTVELSWTMSSVNDKQSFELERSPDGISFATIAAIPESGTPGSTQAYHYTDAAPAKGMCYYRLKHILEDNRPEYSVIIPVKTSLSGSFAFFFSPARQELQITATTAGTAFLYDAAGRPLRLLRLQAGSNRISTQPLASGIYFVRSPGNGAAYKFCVLR